MFPNGYFSAAWIAIMVLLVWILLIVAGKFK